MALGVKTGGRVSGTPNKKTQDLLERLEALGVDPLAGLAAIANDDSAPLELRAKVQCELMMYIYPKRKALEVSSATKQPVSIRISLAAPPVDYSEQDEPVSV